MSVPRNLEEYGTGKRGDIEHRTPDTYTDRDTYRGMIRSAKEHFRVTVKETDLFIHAPERLKDKAMQLVFDSRGQIESHIGMFPEFAKTLRPWRVDGPAPVIIRAMAEAGRNAGVGPMAAVAGAVAEYVGTGLLSDTGEVIVENGGDIFIMENGPVTVGIFAGASPLSLKLGLRFEQAGQPFAVCASSGTVGHSKSMGRADAVCVASESCPLADAVATAVGNRVESERDIENAIKFGKKISGVTGVVIIVGEKIGAWGDLEVVSVA